MIKIQDIKLVDLLPPNLAQDQTVRAAAEALDKELQAVTAAIDECLLVPRIDLLPEAVVDLLAWQYHVDFYRSYLPLKQKRALVKNSLKWHKQKGTPAAVEEVVSAAFSHSRIEEWWEYGGLPYHFRVIVEGLLDDQIEIKDLPQAIETVKNIRSKLETIRLILRTTPGDFEIDIAHTSFMCIFLSPVTSPWATVSDEPQLFFDGAAKFDGEYFFSARKTGDGPGHLIAVDIKQTVEHLFGVFTELINPLFDGMYRFDGKILFDSVPTELPVPAKQSVFVMPTVFAANEYEVSHSTSTAVSHTSFSGVAAFDGRFTFDGGLNFDNALIEHPATLRVYQGGILLEEVLV